MPADVFYEWKVVANGKQPYAIARQDEQPMAFAGLWEGFRWPDGNVTRSFAIITTDASPDVAELHDRMPVILEPADWPVWLGEQPDHPGSLLRPTPAGTLRRQNRMVASRPGRRTWARLLSSRNRWKQTDSFRPHQATDEWPLFGSVPQTRTDRNPPIAAVARLPTRTAGVDPVPGIATLAPTAAGLSTSSTPQLQVR